MMKNTKILAIKQAAALSIDISIVSFPLIIAPSLEILPLFALMWYLYIPLMEYYKSQTLGMIVVGTSIINTSDMKSNITFGTAVRRQIARIGMVWGVIGWLFLLAGKQYVSDYAIVDKNYSSINADEEGWVKVHNENQYKVIFFVLFLFFVFSYVQGVMV